MYISFLLSTLLPLLAAALPSSSPEALSRRTASTPFTLLADYNNDPNVGGSATHASNDNFFIGRDTAVSCPTPGQPCPSSNETALTVNDATGIASMVRPLSTSSSQKNPSNVCAQYSRYSPHQNVYIAVNGALSCKHTSPTPSPPQTTPSNHDTFPSLPLSHPPHFPSPTPKLTPPL